jgi:hypothetical protein
VKVQIWDSERLPGTELPYGNNFSALIAKLRSPHKSLMTRSRPPTEAAYFNFGPINSALESSEFQAAYEARAFSVRRLFLTVKVAPDPSCK